MKMVRSLLLGTAAGFVALTGAQAADLPVKAKPVQYVKICDLYGAGYFYVPGTDTCMKIGGYVRFNMYLDANSGFGYFGPAPFGGVDAFYNRRDTQDVTWRSRIWMTGDVRSQTSLGTLRSYYAMQFTNAGPGDTATATAMVRGFIQLAGFTIGRTTSLFDLPDAHSPLTNSGIPGFGGSTGPTGIEAIQYTAALGNGISASIGLESPDQRRRSVVNLSRNAYTTTVGGGTAVAILTSPQFGFFGPAPGQPQNSAVGSNAVGGGNIPDVVANIDVTQAWGSARLAGALHSVTGDYYTGVLASDGSYVPAAPCAALGGSSVQAGTTVCGNPSDQLGWAVAGGFTITAIPGLPGDLVGISAAYSHGASGYTLGINQLGIVDGGSAAIGPGTDGIFVNGRGIELTDVWYVTAAYQHNWTPTLKTSIFGGYTAISYSSAARGYFCGGAGAPAASGGTAAATATAPAQTGLTAVSNCNPDWSYWQIGSRVFNWTPVPNFDIGLDVIYWNFNSAFAGTATFGPAGAQPASTRTLGTESVWTAVLQIQRSFWP